MIGCVLAGMGAALLPRSVLETFPEAERLRCHPLPRGKRLPKTLCIWRRGVTAPNVDAFTRRLQDGEAHSRGDSRGA